MTVDAPASHLFRSESFFHAIDEINSILYLVEGQGNHTLRIMIIVANDRQFLTPESVSDLALYRPQWVRWRDTIYREVGLRNCWC